MAGGVVKHVESAHMQQCSRHVRVYTKKLCPAAWMMQLPTCAARDSRIYQHCLCTSNRTRTVGVPLKFHFTVLHLQVHTQPPRHACTQLTLHGMHVHEQIQYTSRCNCSHRCNAGWQHPRPCMQTLISSGTIATFAVQQLPAAAATPIRHNGKLLAAAAAQYVRPSAINHNSSC